MSRQKLQLCVSFKNTSEEIAIFNYVNNMPDKSIFIKNLIRNYMNGTVIDVPKQVLVKDEYNEVESKVKLNHGKNTRNKFLI